MSPLDLHHEGIFGMRRFIIIAPFLSAFFPNWRHSSCHQNTSINLEEKIRYIPLFGVTIRVLSLPIPHSPFGRVNEELMSVRMMLGILAFNRC
jgi:hypothetical protein